MESRETPDGLDIGGGVRIPADELSYRTSRSSGPGGQHVNKVETRVTVLFDLDGSPSLSEAQKERVRERLPTRITKAGVLWVVSQKHRSQKANRDAARGDRVRGSLILLDDEQDSPTEQPVDFEVGDKQVWEELSLAAVGVRPAR